MLSEAIRARLASLNRRPLPAVVKARLPTVAETSPGSLPGCETSSELGTHWLIRRPLSALAPGLATAGRDGGEVENQHDDLRRLAEHLPGGTLLFDLETCGFAGSMVFLIGIIRQDGSETVVEQLLARDYREERSVLCAMLEHVASYPLLVSFNGKSFDWPMVRDRSECHRLGRLRGLAPAHVDLLHHARRKWKHELPDCRLQTLERMVCGRRRYNDIPGFAVPAAYHRYVATGETGDMTAILHHNALDLATLYELALRITQ